MVPVDPAPAEAIPLSKLPNFDPRAVPVHAVDAHLPPVPAERLTPAALRRRVADPPAWEAEIVRELRFTDRQPAEAAVLVPVVMREQPMVLLTERATHLSTHSGQVAFPGGKRDPEDRDAADTALREAEEEVGLQRAFAEVIGTMPRYTTGTMFMITPVVALVRPDHRLELNPHEVAAAFEVPLAFFMNPAHHRLHRFEHSGIQRQWFSMPYMDGTNERFVWGATAAMLRNLYRLLAA
jgi:8-oxo-dGTP pyrophosphatase MutT (NUDIX family)